MRESETMLFVQFSVHLIRNSVVFFFWNAVFEVCLFVYLKDNKICR